MLSDTHVRAFVALLVLTVASLLLTRWLLKGTTLYEAFERRRNYWLMALVITFGVGNFFVAMALLGALFFWAAKKDPMPIGIYMMFLLAVPPAAQSIDGFGNINQLFALNSLRMLSLAVLLPLAIRLMIKTKATKERINLSPWFTDAVVLVLVVYILGCHTPFETPTQLMRRGFHLLVDILLPYFVISRYLRDRASVKDALGSLLVSALILAPIGIFEHFKLWLLYETVHQRWEEMAFSIFLMRDTELRAMVASGHSLVFGHFLAVCFGLFGIYRREFTRWRQVFVWVVLILALYSTVSRGPWLAAALVVVAMGLFTAKVLKFYALTGATVLVVTGALILSPWGDKVISFLPFIGTVDSDNVDYRRLLLDTAWTLIQQRPFFGSVNTLQDMENLRQGQGIIDIVNVYVDYAVHYGLIRATLFVLFIASGLSYGLLTSLRTRKNDREMFFLAGNAAVALLGSAFLLVGISDYLSVPRIYTALVAILVVLARLGHQPRSRMSAIHASSGGPVAVR